MNIHAQIDSVKKAGMLAQNTFRGSHSSSLAASSQTSTSYTAIKVHNAFSTTNGSPHNTQNYSYFFSITLAKTRRARRRKKAFLARASSSGTENKTLEWFNLRSTRHDAATDLRGRTPFARLHAFDLLPTALGEERENDVHKKWTTVNRPGRLN